MNLAGIVTEVTLIDGTKPVLQHFCCFLQKRLQSHSSNKQSCKNPLNGESTDHLGKHWPKRICTKKSCLELFDVTVWHNRKHNNSITTPSNYTYIAWPEISNRTNKLLISQFNYIIHVGLLVVVKCIPKLSSTFKLATIGANFS